VVAIPHNSAPRRGEQARIGSGHYDDFLGTGAAAAEGAEAVKAGGGGGAEEEDEAPFEGRVLDPLPMVLLLFRLVSRVVCLVTAAIPDIANFFFAAAPTVGTGGLLGGEAGTGGFFDAATATGFLVSAFVFASFASPSESVRVVLLAAGCSVRSRFGTESAVAVVVAGRGRGDGGVLRSSAVRSIEASDSAVVAVAALIASLPRLELCRCGELLGVPDGDDGGDATGEAETAAAAAETNSGRLGTGGDDESDWDCCGNGGEAGGGRAGGGGIAVLAAAAAIAFGAEIKAGITT